MINERINLWQGGEYNYPAAYGFEPNIRTYIHDDNENIKRDCMIVVPGGSYCMVVPNEGEIVAKEFYNRGLNTFVLTYTTDITTAFPVMYQPENDLSRAVRLIRKNAERFRINENRVFICGFSAGGHLCASLATHHASILDVNEELNLISNRPTGAILSYPVITMGEFTESFTKLTLTGSEPSEETVNYFSLEKCVDKNTCPCFVWHTATDGLVPSENTELFTRALIDNKINYAKYIFPSGDHGLGLANKDYLDGKFGEPFTFEQLNLAVEAVRNGTSINVSEARKAELIEQFGGNSGNESQKEEEVLINEEIDYDIYSDVRLWPELAMKWMGRL